VAPHDFQRGERVDLKVNKLTSTRTQVRPRERAAQLRWLSHWTPPHLCTRLLKRGLAPRHVDTTPRAHPIVWLLKPRAVLLRLRQHARVSRSRTRHGHLAACVPLACCARAHQIPYEYYSLPFCEPRGGVEMSAENLGEFLTGDRIDNSPYQLCVTYCIHHKNTPPQTNKNPNSKASLGGRGARGMPS